MTLITHNEVEQGSDEWHTLRRGIVTASVVGQLITQKTMKPSNNETSRGMARQLAAERITGRTEDVYVTRNMERGNLDEPLARDKYAEHFAPVLQQGFMVEDDWGFGPSTILGYSPDGLVGDDGLIEIKSRQPKIHLGTILADEAPAENMAQIQCGLLVSGRAWCDYVSFCSGMPLWVKRVMPDPDWQAAIIAAAHQMEATVVQMITDYEAAVADFPATEYVDHFLEVELQL